MSKLVIPYDITAEIHNRVECGLVGYVGQDDAVYAVKRVLRLALASVPPMLGEVMLFTGPSSAGKTELANRVGQVMELPFTVYAGTAVRDLRQVATAMQRAALAHNLRVERIDDRGGMPAYRMPPMIVAIDEAHLMRENTQQAFLTAFAANDRTMVVERDREDIVYDVSQVGFILCTTHPASLVRTLRNRCTEIALRAYRAEEVETMVRNRYEMLPADVVKRIVACSKVLPRKALKLAELVLKESASSGDRDLMRCLGIVARGSGIVAYDGLTRNDVIYLRTLARLNGRVKPKPAGINLVTANLPEIERHEVLQEIEPFLLQRRNIESTERGRLITATGLRILEEHSEEAA